MSLCHCRRPRCSAARCRTQHHRYRLGIVWTAQGLTTTELALKELGLVSSLPITAEEVFANRKSHITNHSLIAWNFDNPESLNEQVNLIINYDLDQRNRKLIRPGDYTISILAIADLIAMKRESGKPQDLADVEAQEKIS